MPLVVSVEMDLRALTAILFASAMSACGPLNNIRLVEDPAPLTSSTEDSLFTLSLNSGGFNVFLLGINAHLPGQPETRLRCRDVGPSTGDDYVFACGEPRADLFDATAIGKRVRVSLVATKPEDRSLTEYPLTELTWTPAN